jgi:hypothetical protein
MQTLSLAGAWRYVTDESDIGISQGWYKSPIEAPDFFLPGSACENNIGTPVSFPDEMTKESVRCLRQHHTYTGVLWLERDVTIPDSWDKKQISLFLERVMFFSSLWVDGKPVGIEEDSLSTPHIYNLGALTPGMHRFTIRLDNRNRYHIDTMASGYTDDTQSIWLGAVGLVELQACEPYHIAHLAVYPDIENKQITVKTSICAPLHGLHSIEEGTLTLQAEGPDGTLPLRRYPIRLHHARQTRSFTYDMGDSVSLWDEFSPALYTLTAVLDLGNTTDTLTQSFGMREFRTDGRQFTINRMPTFLRGTLDCCVYPLTGYPPTDLDSWLRICRSAKEYGLNHIRFHSWCPPEAAFQAADMTGIYVLAEMPLWLNRDVCALEFGEHPAHELFFRREAKRISEWYGTHPSFCMFSCGNELLGDFSLLEDIIAQTKAIDSRRVYTLTSNFDRPVTPSDDYFCAFHSDGHGIRAQYFHDTICKDTCLAYPDGVQAQTVPVVSFEVGQYCVYPDIREIPKYSGNLSPVNFQAIKADLEKKHLAGRIDDFVRASGALAALLYKEDIEAALRTPEMGGFELLGLSDYPGQCTATIGLLNSFWENKGILSAEEFRAFCSPVVPLFQAKRIFKNTDTLDAVLCLADFRKSPAASFVFTLTMKAEGQVLYQTQTKETSVSIPLGFISSASMVTVELSVEEYTNSWNIFVYPDAPDVAGHVLTADAVTPEVEYAIANGGRILLFATSENLANPIAGKFYPVFWSPAYFPSSNPCGILCDNTHPVFDRFPTGRYADFQWYSILEHSVSIDISSLPDAFSALVEPVPNFFDNTRMANLFEVRVGNADILVCGYDLSREEPEIRQMNRSILSYINSGKFSPKQTLSRDTFLALFRTES